MGDGTPIEWSLYVYAPNKGAAIFFTIAFAASAAGHLWQCYRYKCWKLMALHPLCAVLFTFGYALREYGAFNYLYSTRNLIIYILSQVFIYICPPMLELANYHVLGRVFYYVPYFAPLDPGKVLATFGILSMVVELLNSLGVSLVSNPSSSSSTQNIGSHLTTAALVLQVVIIVTFVVLAVVFHRRCAKENIRVKPVLETLTTLYISTVLIFVRCVYRLVEETGNTTVDLDNLGALMALSPALRYEWFFYVFEATLMLINSVLWNLRNPRRYLPINYRVHLSRDGTAEIEGEDMSDNRPLLATIFDPFGLVVRKKKDPMFYGLNDHSAICRRA